MSYPVVDVVMAGLGPPGPGGGVAGGDLEGPFSALQIKDGAVTAAKVAPDVATTAAVETLSSLTLKRAGADLAHRLGANGDEPGAFVAWTADDGYTTQADYFDLLDTKGILGTLFVTQDWVDRSGVNGSWGDTYITSAQVQAIADAGHELGTHGVSHEGHTQYLQENGVAAFVTRFAGCKAWIEDTFGVEVKSGAYPAGQSNDRVRELMARIGHEFYRGTKGLVTRGPSHPQDVPAVDVQNLTEAAIKVHVDTAVANRSPAIFLVHGGLTTAHLTKFSNVMDYVSSLGVPQGSFYQAMSERTMWRSTGAFVDALGRAWYPMVRANRIELFRSDEVAEAAWFDIEETTNTPYYDSFGNVPFEWRAKTTFRDDVMVTRGANGFIIQPEVDELEGGRLFWIKRSTDPAELNPGGDIFYVQQDGTITIVTNAGAQVQFTTGGRTWQAVGAGGPFVIYTGTGGSNLDARAAAIRLLRTADSAELARLRASPASSTRGALQLTGTGPIILHHNIAPEGVVNAPPGSLCLCDDGSGWRKSSGTGNSGWVAM